MAGVQSFEQTPAWSYLVLSLASLIDSLCDTGSKPSIKRSSLVQTRRLLRMVGISRSRSDRYKDNFPLLVETPLHSQCYQHSSGCREILLKPFNVRTIAWYIRRCIVAVETYCRSRTWPRIHPQFEGCEESVYILWFMHSPLQQSIRTIWCPFTQLMSSWHEHGCQLTAWYCGLFSKHSHVYPSSWQSSFHDFVSNFVNESDLFNGLLPILEKALIRSPEVSLDGKHPCAKLIASHLSSLVVVLASLLNSYRRDISPDLLKRLLGSILGCAKSGNAQVRAGSVEAFASVISNQGLPGSLFPGIVNELLVLLKAGKTSSPDHRQTLYTMLSRIKPVEEVFSTIAFTLPALLAKESSDNVIPALRDALSVHFAVAIAKNQHVPPDVTSIFIKETNGAKGSIRRSFLHVVGNAFEPQGPEGSPFADPEQRQRSWFETSKKFAEALLPSLESDLKATVAAPLNAAVGPMEGYVAIATFIHPFSPILQPRRQGLYDLLALTGSKPSFLVWDKVYTKLTTADEEFWLARALACAFTQGQSDLAKNGTLRCVNNWHRSRV